MFSAFKRIWKHGMATKPKQELLMMVGNGRPILDVTSCNACGDCVKECPTEALRIQDEQLTIRIKQVFGRSLHIRHVDSGSCNGCEWETTALMNPVYDIQRFGIDFVASPRHADMLLVTGGVTRNLLEALLKTHDGTAMPKIVVAIGACACSGGIIGETYANLGGLDKVLPVSVYVPGCPPRPQAILEGILAAMGRAQELEPKERKEGSDTA